MPQVARVGDADTNHPPCGAGSCATGSPNVLVNNIPLHRVGDNNTPHGFISVSYTHLTLPTNREV